MPALKTQNPPAETRRTVPIVPDQVIPQAPRRRAASDVFKQLEPTPQEIRDRAYFIYLARGGAPGCADSDWLTAEHELRTERGLPPKKAVRGDA